MNKYFHVVRIGIENTLVYRFNFFVRAAFSLVPLMAVIMLWRTVYRGQTNMAISGLSLPGMISYYLLVTIVDTLSAVTEDDWQIAADIKDGNISQFLIRPIDYMAYRLCIFFSGRLIFTVVSLVPVGFFIYYWRDYFVAPASLMHFGWFLVSVVLAALLQFFISYTLALLAFWLMEVSTVIFIVFSLEYLASGHLFPINILPPWAITVVNCTPFPYQLFFPVSIYLGQVSGWELARGMVVQALWVVFAGALARTVWDRGIRKYSAAGG